MIELTKQANGSYVCAADPGEPGYRQQRVSVTDEEAAMLAGFASGRVVLEIGTGLGVSTRAMAETADHITTVDSDPWVQTNVWPSLSGLIGMRAAVENLPYTNEYNLVFIDGHHERASVLSDVQNCLKVATPGALYILHDANAADVREAARLAGLHVFGIWPTTHGLGFAVKA